jgi:hypothetical protein
MAFMAGRKGGGGSGGKLREPFLLFVLLLLFVCCSGSLDETMRRRKTRSKMKIGNERSGTTKTQNSRYFLSTPVSSSVRTGLAM